LAFKFARDARGRASNLYEAKLYRTANATRRALLCPVLWVSRNGFVQIMRAAQPLTDMMSLDEYMDVAELWDKVHRRRKRRAIENNSHRTATPGSSIDPPTLDRFFACVRIDLGYFMGWPGPRTGDADIRRQE
jgi:hypothetical protein